MSDEDFQALMAFEQGRLPQEQVIALFQRLIDGGDVWRLPGCYTRVALALIEDGCCLLGPVGHTELFGHCLPSRYEARHDQPGSVAYFHERRHRRGLE